MGPATTAVAVMRSNVFVNSDVVGHSQYAALKGKAAAIPGIGGLVVRRTSTN